MKVLMKWSQTCMLMLVAGPALFVPALAEAQIVAPSGRTLFNRGVMLRSVVRLDLFSPTQPGSRSRRIVNNNAVVWGAAPHLSLSFVTPFVVLDRDGSTTSGTGDSAIFARYDLFRKNVPGGTTRLAPEVGVRLPTGGAFGSGSTSYIGSLVFSHVRDPHWFVTDLQLTTSTQGDELRPGNRWRYDMAYLFRLLPRRTMGVPSLLLVVELNGESAERSRRDGEPLPDTGGHLLFLSPGLEYIVSRRVVLEFSFPLRLAEDLNGTQLKPTSSFLFGVRWLN